MSIRRDNTVTASCTGSLNLVAALGGSLVHTNDHRIAGRSLVRIVRSLKVHLQLTSQPNNAINGLRIQEGYKSRKEAPMPLVAGKICRSEVTPGSLNNIKEQLGSAVSLRCGSGLPCFQRRA